MKKVLLILSSSFGVLLSAAAQDGAIYRCGNEYTNTATPDQMKNCKLVTGGNVTIVQTPKPSTKAAVAARAGVADAAQRERDSDARAILESELRKAEARLAELQKEYNNGEPDQRGDEARNHQKYLDRVAELKASLARTQSDIAGITRELARAPASR